MKPSDLRIGNLIDYGGDNYVYVDIKILKDILDDSQDDAYQSIPLTEEWLVRFGFEKDEDLNFEKSDVLIQSWSHNKTFHYVNNHGCSDLTIKFVHQLQNLYFALTETELILQK